MEFCINTCIRTKEKIIKHKKVFIGAIILKIAVFFLMLLFASKSSATASSININYRQVKSADSPVVFYLDHVKGLKKAYISEKSFLSYGNKWSDIKIVSASELKKWPEVQLIKVKDDARVYYIENNKKAWIKTEKEFNDYNFKWKDVINVSSTDLSMYKDTDLASLSIQKIAISGVGSQDASNKLKISLDAANPDSYIIPINTNNNLVGAFTLSSTNSVVQVNEIKIKINGLFNRDLLKDAKLIIGSSTEAKRATSRNANEIRFYFIDPLLIDASSSKTIKVYVDLEGSSENISNNTLQLSIDSVGSLNTGSEIIGNFPINFNIHTLINGQGILGKASAEELTLGQSSPQLVIGTTAQKVINFKITETSGKEDIVLKKIVIANVGSASGGELEKFILRDGANKNIANADKMNNDQKITFNINNYLIQKGKSQTFTVLADIKDGDKQAINMQIDEINSAGKELGYSGSTEIKNINESIAIARKNLGIMTLALTPTKNVFSKQSGVILGAFDFRNNNKRITLEKINVELVKSDAAQPFSNPITLVNYDTGEILSSSNNNSNKYVLDLSGLAIYEKKNIKIALISEIPDSARQGDNYNLIINTIAYRTETGSLFTEEPKIKGQTLIVSRSNLYIYNDSKNDGLYYSKGQKDVKIGSFFIEASSGDNAKITSITFQKGNTSGIVNYDNGFSNLHASIGGRKVGAEIAQPFTDSFLFSGFEYKLTSGRRYEVNLYADTLTDLNVTETSIMISNLTAYSQVSGINSVVTGLNTESKKVLFGMPQVEITSVSGGKIIVGEKANLIGSFKIKNTGDERIDLRYLTVITSNEGLSYSRGYKNMKIVDAETNKTLSSISRPVSSANIVNMGRKPLEKGAERIFNVYIDADCNVPSESFQLYFTELEAISHQSSIKANVSGGPTESVSVVVN